MSKTVKLGDIANVTAGQSAPQGNCFSDKGTPFIRAGSLESLLLGKRENELELVSEEVANAKRLKLQPAGTIVFAKSGMSCMKGYVYVLKTPCYVVSHLACVLPKDGCSDYLAYYFKWHKPNQLVKDDAYPSISLADISNVSMKMHGKDEQQKIAAVLDKVTALIADRKEQLEQLDLMVKSRFVEMFGDGRFQTVRLEAICDFITKGTTPPTSKIYDKPFEGSIPYLKVYNLSDSGELRFFQAPQYIDADIHNGLLARSKVYPNDVLMNIVGLPLGKFALVPNIFAEWNINQAMAIFRSKGEVIPFYLMYAMMQPNVLRPFIEKAVGIRQINLSLAQCRELEIPLPPLPLQNRFADFVAQADKSKLEIKQGLEEQELQYNALMQKYFR